MRLARRCVLALLGSSALAGFVRPARTEGRWVTIGINLPLTGASAEDATTILHGAVLAIEEANAKGGPRGYEVRVLSLDDGTATAGQYDPVQAATNARKMVVDPRWSRPSVRWPAAAARRWRRCSARATWPL
jgi:branched-chain amino acid transport system substrate-binding protein